MGHQNLLTNLYLLIVIHCFKFIQDVFAYNNVGIPKERIFIVNTKGQLRIEKSTTFSST